MAPAPCNYLLKTLADKRKKNLSKLSGEQQSLPRDRRAAKAGHGLSGSPMSLAPLQCPGLMARTASRSHGTRRVQGLSEEEPCRGCVQDKAGRSRAVCLSNAALPWHLLSPLTAEPSPSNASAGPDPTERATAGRGPPEATDEPLVTLSGSGPLKPLFPDDWSSWQCPYPAQPLIMDHSPSQPSGPFFSSVSWLCSSFSH